MKCWICCVTAYTNILEYVFKNVTISYDKIKYDIFEMLPYSKGFSKHSTNL